MAEKMTLARPYAEAVFALAKERNKLAAWSNMLRMVAFIAADARVARLLDDPRVGRERVVGLFVGIGGDQLDDDAANLIRLLADNRRLPLLPEIALLFEEFKAEQERTVDAEVVSALPLSEAQVKQFAGALKKRLGREVRVTPKVDASLIGGAIVRAGDLVIDGSVKGRLSALSSYLYR
jgi:F-type H+-transporting ATPase subunit delta